MEFEVQIDHRLSETSKSLPQNSRVQSAGCRLVRRITKPQEQLEQLLTCQICYSAAKNIMMCPNCSKIYCQTCIKKSLMIKSQCPHCRKTVRDHKSMANCQRFVNDVKGIVEQVLKEKHKQNFRCEEHDVPLNYYCVDCQTSVCCQCKMFGAHKEHNLVQIEKKYQQKYQKLRSMLAQLKVATKQKQKNVNEFNNLFDQTNLHFKHQIDIINKLEQSQGNQIFSLNKKQKQGEQNIIFKLQKQLQKITQLKRNLRTDFSKLKKEGKYNFNDYQKSNLKKNIQLINAQTQSVQSQILSNKSFLSDLIPPYTYNTFKIENFSKRQKQQKCVIFSDPVQVLGYQWKLKIFPNGSQHVQGKYLSIYVMMESNKKANKTQKVQYDEKKGPSLYEYSIEINTQHNYQEAKDQTSEGNHKKEKGVSKKFLRQYSSTFEPGQSWGYNKFIELKDLKGSAFIDALDCLTIKYGIRRPDYFTEYKSCLKELQFVDKQIQIIEQKTLQNIQSQIPAQKNQPQSQQNTSL